jgi:hypothetical protein
MAVTRDSFTEDRLSRRLGAEPARLPNGAYDLGGANLAQLKLSKAQLAGANLCGTVLRGADLQRAVLAGANLAGADLSESLLQDADLRGADLRGALLDRATLDGTLVRGAILRDAGLAGTRVRNTALWEAGLEPADAEGALLDLRGLFDLGPQKVEAPQLLLWCMVVGGDPERWALRAAAGDRRWRAWRREIEAARQALDARLGPLTDASLSRAAPGRLGPGSLSRADDPGAQPRGGSLSLLRRWRRGESNDQAADEPET